MDDSLDASVKKTMRTRVKDVIHGVRDEIGIVGNAMARIKSPSQDEAAKFLTVPMQILREKLDGVIERLNIERDLVVDVNYWPAVVAELIKCIKPKQSYVVASLILTIGDVSWKVVHEVLLEDAFGEEHGENMDWDGTGRFGNFPEPSRDMELYDCDKLLTGIVTYINTLVISQCPSKNPGGWMFGYHNYEKNSDLDVVYLLTFLAERDLIRSVIFDKEPNGAAVRAKLIEIMHRVTPLSFAKSLDGYPFNGVPGVQCVIDGFTWPEMLKYIDLVARRPDPDTKMPTWTSTRSGDNGIFETRSVIRLNDIVSKYIHSSCSSSPPSKRSRTA